MNTNIFENLHILEAASNHHGDVDRGKEIVTQHANVVKKNGVRAAIKLQFRDAGYVNTHALKKHGNDAERNRWIQKAIRTTLDYDEKLELVNHIKESGCMAMATPFDEQSVQDCVDLELPILKVASADIGDKSLMTQVAQTGKPVIFSTGGATTENIDWVVNLFTKHNVEMAINHCVAAYPTPKNSLQLNQIDFLRLRYPGITVGLSTHEGPGDWQSSMLISYAKGARTWERHVDIDYPVGKYPQSEVSAYCSTPSQVDVWLKAYLSAKAMCGETAQARRRIDLSEVSYLQAHQRGLYVKRNLKVGEKFHADDLYRAVPFTPESGQVGAAEAIPGDLVATKDIAANEPLAIDCFQNAS